MNSHGGSYKIDGKGGVTLVERTQPHPEGNRPRTADGTPINRVEQQPAVDSTRPTSTKKGKE